MVGGNLPRSLVTSGPIQLPQGLKRLSATWFGSKGMIWEAVADISGTSQKGLSLQDREAIHQQTPWQCNLAVCLGPLKTHICFLWSYTLLSRSAPLFLLRNYVFVELSTTEGFPGYPALSKNNYLASGSHCLALLKQWLSAFTASQEEDSRFDSFHKLCLRTMSFSRLNLVLGQYLKFPNNRNQLKLKSPAQSPFLCLLHTEPREECSTVILTLELKWTAEITSFNSLPEEMSCQEFREAKGNLSNISWLRLLIVPNTQVLVAILERGHSKV